MRQPSTRSWNARNFPPMSSSRNSRSLPSKARSAGSMGRHLLVGSDMIDHPARQQQEFAMAVVTLQEAQATLSDLIHRLTPGEEVLITENNQPVARILPTADKKNHPRKLGTL